MKINVIGAETGNEMGSIIVKQPLTRRNKILVTAGNTQTPIDQVRSITNIFKGKTGASIANEFAMAHHDVVLLTSNPESIEKFDAPLKIIKYRTYDELMSLMEDHVKNGNYDVIIHSSAVSDYKVEGTYVRELVSNSSPSLVKIDSSGKVGSDHKELYLKLIPTEKIVDKIRKDWGYKGVLVKFKLQVGISDEELIEIAKKSMVHSDADIIVANTLEASREKAFVINKYALDGSFVVLETKRSNLPSLLMKKCGFEYVSSPESFDSFKYDPIGANQ